MVPFDVPPHLNMIQGLDTNFDKILANIYWPMAQLIQMISSKNPTFSNKGC